MTPHVSDHENVIVTGTFWHVIKKNGQPFTAPMVDLKDRPNNLKTAGIGE